MPRLALMVPQRNAALEPESYQLVPSSVSVHFARLQGSLISEEALHNLSLDIKSAWLSLVDIKPQVVGFACTSGSFYGGQAEERHLRHQMQRLVQKPFITTSLAVVLAAKALKLRRIAVVTPYADWLNKRLVAFLTEHGLEVVALQGMGLTSGISDVDLTMVGQSVEAADRPEAEGIFLSCTALRTLDGLAAWEDRLQKPVFSANLATVWLALKLIEQPIRDVGAALIKKEIMGGFD